MRAAAATLLPAFFFAVLLPTESFVFDQKLKPFTDLANLIEVQTEKRVDIGLDIREPKGGLSRLSINGLVFDLTKRVTNNINKNKNNSKQDFVKMPGYHGPRALLSGGLHALQSVREGTFISMAGPELVKPSHGCWEITWRDGAPCGSLLYGFEIERDYQRNDATLPKGTVYVSFSTWTAEGLEKARGVRDRKTEVARKALRQRDEEVEKMGEARNVFEKAVHYFRAMSAADVAYAIPSHSRLRNIPGKDEILHFDGDMHVSKTGRVWTQDLPWGKPVVLGSARMNSVDLLDLAAS